MNFIPLTFNIKFPFAAWKYLESQQTSPTWVHSHSTGICGYGSVDAFENP